MSKFVCATAGISTRTPFNSWSPGAGRFLWLQHHRWCALAPADAGAGAADGGAAAVALPAVWQPGAARRGDHQPGTACGVATGMPRWDGGAGARDGAIWDARVAVWAS